MTAWTDPDRAIVARYLGKLRLRSANSRICYRQVLHGFQDVAERHLTINRQTLEEWLRESGAHWHPSTVLHRARIVDRFLDHLVGSGLITSNPILVLCSEYSIMQSRPIWQALTSPMPDQALAALRRPKPFGSVLGETMREHIERMRSRGYRSGRRLHGSCGSIDSFRSIRNLQANRSRRCWTDGPQPRRPVITSQNARS